VTANRTGVRGGKIFACSGACSESSLPCSRPDSPSSRSSPRSREDARS